jgi:hypothetical protein
MTSDDAAPTSYLGISHAGSDVLDPEMLASLENAPGAGEADRSYIWAGVGRKR